MSTELIVSENTPVEVHARGEAALARLDPEINALAPDELSTMNVDPGWTASRVLGAVPAIVELHGRIARECPTADLKAIDQLEDRACALLAINVQYESAVITPPGFTALTTEAFEARNVLLAIAQTFVSCNMLKAEQIATYKGGRGYHDLADDVLLLTGVLKAGWVHYENKAPITLAQIERLQGVGEELTRLNGIRDAQPQRVSQLADKRLRVLTLVDQAYDEARRVITYLRWREGDADSIVAALRGRNNGRPKADDKSANAATGKPGETAAPTQPGLPAKPATPAIPVVDTVVMQPVTTAKPEDKVAPVVPMEIPPAPSGLPRNKPFGNV